MSAGCDQEDPTLKTHHSNESTNRVHLDILLLGEGDFTFTLDLLSYMTDDQTSDLWSNQRQVRIASSGFDSFSDLNKKYADISSTIRGIRVFCNEVTDVDVYHGINAVDDLNRAFSKSRLVIFNHPHLGVEDSRLHALFLSHLFYSVKSVLSEDGHFCLTLAAGQYERWDCLEAAHRHNFKLCDRRRFRPPPGTSKQKRYYTFRRHQNGKSFHTRTDGFSETFLFSLSSSKKLEEIFSWYSSPDENITVRDAFCCQFCNKAFLEQRSLRNHIKCKHEEIKAGPSLKCIDCDRDFTSTDGLKQHMIAKHGFENKTVPADRGKILDRMGKGGGTCPICGHQNDEDHMKLFNPEYVIDMTRLDQDCVYCRKRFRDTRSRHQHEIMCPSRCSGIR